jgi:cell division protein FtsB
MAERAPGSGRNRSVKRRARAPLALRLAGRIGAGVVGLLICGLVTIQFARVIDENLALANQVSATQTDIDALQARRAWQVRQLKRLQDPEGAVPEIHDRLKLVKPNEAIIFVSPAPTATLTP